MVEVAVELAVAVAVVVAVVALTMMLAAAQCLQTLVPCYSVTAIS